MGKTANIAKALSMVGDPTRLKILCRIFGSEGACVSDIAGKLGKSIAVVSHHLNALSDAGFLAAKREGKKVCYTFKAKGFAKDLKALICKYL